MADNLGTHLSQRGYKTAEGDFHEFATIYKPKWDWKGKEPEYYGHRVQVSFTGRPPLMVEFHLRESGGKYETDYNMQLAINRIEKDNHSYVHQLQKDIFGFLEKINYKLYPTKTDLREKSNR